MIEKIDINGNNNGYCINNGVLYTKNKEKLVLYPSNKNDEYSILNTTKEILTSAFADNKLIVSFNIPNNVEIIRHNAFRSCKELKEIKIDANKIEDACFAECPKLESITIGKNLKTIEQNIFYGSGRLTSINYEGTIEEWHAITKNSKWNYNSRITTIHCSDGDITL